MIIIQISDNNCNNKINLNNNNFPSRINNLINNKRTPNSSNSNSSRYRRKIVVKKTKLKVSKIYLRCNLIRTLIIEYILFLPIYINI